MQKGGGLFKVVLQSMHVFSHSFPEESLNPKSIDNIVSEGMLAGKPALLRAKFPIFTPLRNVAWDVPPYTVLNRAYSRGYENNPNTGLSGYGK